MNHDRYDNSLKSITCTVFEQLFFSVYLRTFQHAFIQYDLKYGYNTITFYHEICQPLFVIGSLCVCETLGIFGHVLDKHRSKDLEDSPSISRLFGTLQDIPDKCNLRSHVHGS